MEAALPSQMPAVDSETIVAGYDGSAEARLAAMWAAREAHIGQSRLVLVMAMGYPPMSEPAPMPPGCVVPQMPTPKEETVRTHAQAALADVAASCHGEWPDITISTIASPGRAPEVLKSLAENAQLLTIGASLTGLPKVLLGSTAAELLHHHKRPLVVVRGDKDQTEDKRVVVGVDGSEVSTRAIGFTYDFADRHGFELVAVHAWSDLPMDALAPVRTWDYDWHDVQEKGNEPGSSSRRPVNHDLRDGTRPSLMDCSRTVFRTPVTGTTSHLPCRQGEPKDQPVSSSRRREALTPFSTPRSTTLTPRIRRPAA
jgi:nucleotide-binding universal stress UspA family protein